MSWLPITSFARAPEATPLIAERPAIGCHIARLSRVYCYDTTQRRNVTVDEREWLAPRFEEQRPRLRAVAYRMLGSLSEADDAVQEAWLRLSRTDATKVENLPAWLTTVVGRVSLNMLRSRRSRREQPLGPHLPDPIVAAVDGSDPENEALLADSVGLALLVVLETLSPPERLAFVLHDMFDVPFDEIAPIVQRSPAATRRLASRARRRVQGKAPAPEADLSMQWEVVDAFLAAAREGDFNALVAVLDPDVVLRADGGLVAPSAEVRGAHTVASRALAWSRVDLTTRRALINGTAGIVSTRDGQPFSVSAVTVRGGRIVEIDILADPERLARLDLTVLEPTLSPEDLIGRGASG
jgi:RNA polymerase sigma-70 factor (ECF subfamily)